jgi:Tfp pilus assembly protein FimT
MVSLSELLFTVGMFVILGVIVVPSYSIGMHTYHVDSTTYARKEECCG